MLVIGMGVAYMLFDFVVAIILIAVALILGLVSVGLISLLSFLKWPAIIIGIPLGVLSVLAFWIVRVALELPPAVFLRYLSLQFLQAAGPGYVFFPDAPEPLEDLGPGTLSSEGEAEAPSEDSPADSPLE